MCVCVCVCVCVCKVDVCMYVFFRNVFRSDDFIVSLDLESVINKRIKIISVLTTIKSING